MDFSGDIGLWQRRLSEGPEGTTRRLAVFEALTIQSGQAVLDIGCGGGHLVRDVAQAVGESGRAVGLDANAQQLEAARAVCADLPVAELIEGDATDMAFGDATFDSVCSIQTFEYIADVNRALAEARRVLKPGGRAAFVSMMWDHWRMHGAEPELNERIHEAWRAHCPHQMLPLEMPRRLSETGFGGVTRRPIVFFNGALHENAAALWAAKVVAAFVAGQGVAEEDAARWVDQLSESERDGRFGFVMLPMLTAAVAF